MCHFLISSSRDFLQLNQINRYKKSGHLHDVMTAALEDCNFVPNTSEVVEYKAITPDKRNCETTLTIQLQAPCGAKAFPGTAIYSFWLVMVLCSSV